MKYSNRTLFSRIIGSPLTLVAALILCIIIVRAAISIHAKVHTSEVRLAEAKTELDKLKARQTDLSAKVSYLSTNEGIDAEMRTKYKGVKEGESVAVIIDGSQTAAASQASTTPSVSWWGKFWSFFGL